MALQSKKGGRLAERKERHTYREFINSNVACNMHSTLAALCALESSFLSLPSLLPSAWLESTWLGAGSNFYENVACSVCSKALPSCQRQHHSIQTHTHTHTETHPPAHAHLYTRVRLGRRRRAEHTVLHSELDGIKQAGPTSLCLSPLAVTEPVHCADLQRNEICFIMQNANTPDMHSYTVSAHYTYATCAVPQKMSSADDCENTAACMAQVMR